MKELEIRRHTDNDGDVLSDEGVAAAVDLGRRLSGTQWAIAVSTGAQRATQTAACILAGAGAAVDRGVVVNEGLRSDVEDRWRGAYSDVGSGHLDDLRDADPELVDRETEVLGSALRDVLNRIEDGDRALVIGHSPTSEAAILGLTGETVEPLSKGAGVLVRVDGDDYELETLDA